MGAHSEAQQHGCIYLAQPVCAQFDQVYSQTAHSSQDTFLEHLFSLFACKSKETGQLRMRDDLALKFLALQCHTGQFTTSDDFMKHLLQLHIQHSKTEAATRNGFEKQHTRKSRKSQPKRNLKHSQMVSDQDIRDDIPSLLPDLSLNTLNGDTKMIQDKKSPVGVSRSHETQGHLIKAKGINNSPLCLSVQKATVEPLTPTHAAAHGQKASYGRYMYEPLQHDLEVGDDSVPSYPNTPEKHSGEMDTSGSNYTYVLNSLDDSNSGSPVQMPEKYQKSIIYTMSSDEEEPEDLSLSNGQGDEQPQNLTVAKSKLPATGKAEDTIKFDRNANHVPATGHATLVTKSPFILQNQQQKLFSPPANLVFTDQQVARNGMIGQPQVLGIPQTISNTSSQDHSSNISTSGQAQAGIPLSIFKAEDGQVQLIAMQPSQSLSSPVLPPTCIIPNSSSRVTPTSASSDAGITSPNDSTNENYSDSDKGGSSHRKKRKRMEDTTGFRDPPEQSLPFNGPNKYRFYCDVCDTGFTRRYTFNRHKCKGRVEKHYCQLCDKAYLSKYKLKDHILVKHEGQTVNCPDCGKKFSSRSSMEMHKKQQHEGQFSIWCKICGKGFNHTGHYYGHMNKHTNTKPFWCQQCGKRFYGSSYLHNHKQVCRGNNDLNFACNLCDRKFKCELYLKKHMKVHDNVPIIGDPTIVKVTEEELEESQVMVATEADDQHIVANGIKEKIGKPVFPGQPDNSDSNSNSGMLVIDEENPGLGQRGNGKEINP